MDLHVSKHGTDSNDGSPDYPLATVNQAARIAQPGDTVIVHEGIYREWVDPSRGGLSDNRRIVFMAAPGEDVVLTGSEVASDWQPVGAGVWKTVIDNVIFQGFNPYQKKIEGDWLLRPASDEPDLHLGEIYLNGTALMEVGSLGDVENPRLPDVTVDDWTGVPQQSPTSSSLVWHARVHELDTHIHVNFGDVDPNGELVEFNVRRSVFYPTQNHVDYITVRGFEMRHAATPWVPPTADQPGMLGPNWAKGWIIEDNTLHDSKCSAVSLGKEIRTGHNFAMVRKDKPGYQYQLESVFVAEDLGWSKERIGSHVVRRNTIYDCGQNAIVGHLGCAFSTISNNHVYKIGTRRQFYGHEIAGIKLHAPLDVEIVGNNIHDCSLGLWLDWQTQGTRIARNVLHSNSRDLFVEVSHGPYVVDHNIFASPVSLENFSQGGAYLYNLFLGSIRIEPVLDRATPYHLPHSTKVAGYAVIVGGDDRFIGNIFSGDESREAYRVELPGEAVIGYGTSVYNGFPADIDEYLEIVGNRSGDHRRFNNVKQAVTVRDNVYMAEADPFKREATATRLSDAGFRLVAREDGTLHLETDLPVEFKDSRTGVVRGSSLGHVRFVGAEFEAADGADIVFDVDLAGATLSAREQHAAGPVAALTAGATSTLVWPTHAVLTYDDTSSQGA